MAPTARRGPSPSRSATLPTTLSCMSTVLTPFPFISPVSILLGPAESSSRESLFIYLKPRATGRPRSLHREYLAFPMGFKHAEEGKFGRRASPCIGNDLRSVDSLFPPVSSPRKLPRPPPAAYVVAISMPLLTPNRPITPLGRLRDG